MNDIFNNINENDIDEFNEFIVIQCNRLKQFEGKSDHLSSAGVFRNTKFKNVKDFLCDRNPIDLDDHITLLETSMQTIGIFTIVITPLSVEYKKIRYLVQAFTYLFPIKCNYLANLPLIQDTKIRDEDLRDSSNIFFKLSDYVFELVYKYKNGIR